MAGEAGNMSAEEVLNLRDLERDRINKTSEKIMDAIAKDNYRYTHFVMDFRLTVWLQNIRHLRLAILTFFFIIVWR